MAKRLKKLPAAVTRYKGSECYPWAVWLDGEWWELQSRQDFHCDVGSFRSAAKQAAQRRGMKCETRHDGNGKVYIRAVKKS